MHSFWREVLFFHSWGNFSFSGHSLSTNFFQRLADPSMSRSKFLNSSMFAMAWVQKKFYHDGGGKSKIGNLVKWIQNHALQIPHYTRVINIC